MSKTVKVTILHGEEWNEQETAEQMTPVSLPTMHSVGVTQKFKRESGEVITASKLVGQNRWVHDKVVR